MTKCGVKKKAWQDISRGHVILWPWGGTLW